MSLIDRVNIPHRRKPAAKPPAAPLFDTKQTRREAYFGVQRSGRASKNRDAVLEALREIGPASMRQVAQHLDFEINRVTQPFKDLREEDLIELAGTHYDSQTGYKQKTWRVKPN